MSGLWNKHRKLRAILIIIGIIAVLFIGFKLYAYAKLLLGYDITIRLDADKNDIEMMNKQSEEITFSINKISGLFCRTECYSEFTDLSNNEIIENQTFHVLQTIPYEITEKVQAPSNGEGQKVYAFDLTCKNKDTPICNSDEKTVNRRVLITVEYTLSSNQQILKKQAEEILTESYSKFINTNKTMQYINSALMLNNASFLAETNESQDVYSSINEFQYKFDEALIYWNSGYYDSIVEDIAINQSSINIEQAFEKFNTKLLVNTDAYNALADILSTIRQNTESTQSFYLNESQKNELDIFIENLNKKVADFNSANSISSKQDIVKSINISELSKFVNQTGNITLYRSNKTLYAIKEKISLNVASANLTYNLTLPEAQKICCVLDKCGNCEIQTKYPVLLLHGHNFNQDISADNSINIFDSLQSELEGAGYINAGESYLYNAVRDKPALLGMMPYPTVLRASYYFDFMQKPEGYQSVQIKSENLDTYTIRLKEIIENIKYETGSEKIIIVAHSMGGLIARRYVQVFSNESVDRIILIAVPNKGVTKKMTAYCEIFGASLECRDIDSESLFINKLNNQPSDNVKTINIIGTGCEMDGGDGDGIVLSDYAFLNNSAANTENIFLSGDCTSTDFFHNSILDTARYNELADAIKMALA